MAGQVVILPFVAIDTLPDLLFDYSGESTGPIDLTLFSSIVVRVRRSDGILVFPTVVIDDAANGLFHAEWAVGDLIEGTHTFEIVFTDLSAKENTLPKKRPVILQVRGRV